MKNLNVSFFSKYKAKIILGIIIFSISINFQFSSFNLPIIQNSQIAYADDDISNTSFTLDVNSLAPGTEKYSGGPKENLGNILKKISRFLLIIIPTLAVLFIVVGAIKIMLAGGDSGKIKNGKAIVMYNIIAVVLALLSWSIIQLIIWVIGSAA